MERTGSPALDRVLGLSNAPASTGSDELDRALSIGAHAPHHNIAAYNPPVRAQQIPQMGAPAPYHTMVSKSQGANGQQIKDFFISQGLPEHAAAGIVGNIMQESGGDPNAINPQSKAFGLAQFLGSRKQGLFDYADSKGVSPTDASTQLEYMMQEMRGKDAGAVKALKLMGEVDNAADAAKIFATHYERMGQAEANMPFRMTMAEQFMSDGASQQAPQQQQPAPQQPPAPPVPQTSPVADPTVGRWNAALQRAGTGFEHTLEGIGLGTSAAFGAEDTQAKMEALKASQAKEGPGPKSMTVQDIQDIYSKDGLMAAAKEVPGFAAEKTLESLYGTAAPLAAGAAAGMMFPPAAPVTAPLVGIGVAVAQQFGDMMGRQAQEKAAAGDLSPGNALTAASIAGPLDYITDKFTLGMGKAAKAAVKDVAVKEIEKSVAAKVGAAGAGVLGHMGKGVVAEAPTEIAQTALERAQAGLDVTGKEAYSEYKEAGGAGAASGALQGGAGHAAKTAYNALRPEVQPQPAPQPAPVVPPQPVVDPTVVPPQNEYIDNNWYHKKLNPTGTELPPPPPAPTPKGKAKSGEEIRAAAEAKKAAKVNKAVEVAKEAVGNVEAIVANGAPIPEKIQQLDEAATGLKIPNHKNLNATEKLEAIKNKVAEVKAPVEVAPVEVAKVAPTEVAEVAPTEVAEVAPTEVAEVAPVEVAPKTTEGVMRKPTKNEAAVDQRAQFAVDLGEHTLVFVPEAHDVNILPKNSGPYDNVIGTVRGNGDKRQGILHDGNVKDWPEGIPKELVEPLLQYSKAKTPAEDAAAQHSIMSALESMQSKPEAQEDAQTLKNVAQTIYDSYTENRSKPKNIQAIREIATKLDLPVNETTPHREVANMVSEALQEAPKTLSKGIQTQARKVEETVDEDVDEDDLTEYEKRERRVAELAAKKEAQQVETARLEKEKLAQAALQRQTARDTAVAAIPTNAPKAKAKPKGKAKPVVKAVVPTDEDLDALVTSKRKPKTDASLERETLEGLPLEGDIAHEGFDVFDYDDDVVGQRDEGDFDFEGYEPSISKSSALTGHTAASLMPKLSREMKKLVASGKAVIHDTSATLPKGKHHADIQGLTTREGIAHFVANKLTPDTIQDVALHEIGVHVGMKRMVGNDVYNDIAKQALNNKGPAFDKARAAIPASTPKHLRHHEALAYLVEYAPHLPIVRKMIAAIRHFAKTQLGVTVTLSENDAKYLALKALRKESKTGKASNADALAKTLANANLVKTSEKKGFVDTLKKGIGFVTKGDNLTETRKSWVDSSAGLSRALRDLPSMDPDGKLRADLLQSKNAQLYNLVKEAYDLGYVVEAGDGGLMVSEDKSLSLKDIFARIDGLNYPDARETFFTVMRIMAGEANLASDVRMRKVAKDMRKKAKTYDAMAQIERAKIVDTERDLAKLNHPTTTDKVAADQLKTEIAGYKKEYNKRANQAKGQRKEANKIIDRVGKAPVVKGEKVGTEKLVDAQHIADAKALLAADKRIQPIMDDIYSALRKSVDLWESTGVIDEDTASNWRDNPAYIPLYKSKDDMLEDPDKYIEMVKTSPKSLGEVKAREGGTQEVNVGENLVKHFSFMAATAARNLERRLAAEQLTGIGGAYVSGPDDDQAIMFREDGKKVYYHIDDPLAFEAFQAAIPALGAFARYTKGYTNKFRTFTLVNPTYWYRQLVRDPLMANLVSQTRMVTPVDAFVAMGKILAGQAGLGSKTFEKYEKLRRHGVVGAIDSIIETDELLSALPKRKGFLKRKWDWVERIHESSDAATRVAVYEAAMYDAKKLGLKGQDAENFGVMRAREIINFSKKGNARALASIRATVPFFSAQLNGMDTLARAALPGAYGNLNKEEAAKVAKAFYTQAIGMALVSTAFAAVMLDSDDGEDYKKSTDWVDNWLVPTGDKDNPFVKIPLPFEVGFFFKTMPEIWLRMNNGSLSAHQAWKKTKEGALKTLVPPVPISQLLKPIIENFANYDSHTDRPIESFGESRLPREERASHATETSKLISKGLEKLPGDVAGLSPNKVEHLGNGLFTGLFSLVTTAGDFIINQARDEKVSAPTKELHDYPVLKGILTSGTKDSAVSEYYEAAKATSEIYTSLKAAANMGNRKAVKEIKSDAEKRKFYRAAPALEKIGTAISSLQQAIRIIKQKPDSRVSPDIKARRIKVITQKINRLAEKGVKLGHKFDLDL
jgi:hypothetical protein